MRRVRRRLSRVGAVAVVAAATMSPPAWADDGAAPAGPAEEEPLDTPEHTNRLADEQSPYLRQHAHNPVDWYPWGEEAFAKARAEAKPIFLSIGYATCHWCHVMERESFEDDEVAAFLNAHFVAIKVDREERPDVDEIYMSAVQALTGSGGWPLSVWLTPDGRPFTGGTYFPHPARFGRPGFLDVLTAIAQAWREDRDGVLDSAGKVTDHVRRLGAAALEPHALTAAVLDDAVARLERQFDREGGGFGPGRMRFPMPHQLSFLLRHTVRTGSASSRSMAARTLDAIVTGGLRDHLGGGFHRYCVDADWVIPHFEKMLYDQAGLVRALVEGWQVVGEERYADVARETVTFVLREMTSAEGAFTSAWDADSEGEEGRFYVWTAEELRRVLGEDYALFAARYGVTERGNFPELPGRNHLVLAASLEQVAKDHDLAPAEAERRLAAGRARLLAVRAERVPPLHDDKVLADWNGLMIGALASAGRALGEPDYVAAAARAADVIVTHLRRDDGRLLHRYRGGEAAVDGMLEDYAFLAAGLLDLFEATGDPRWLEVASGLVDVLLRDFADEAGGFFQVAASSQLIYRAKPSYDGAIPSGNSVAALALLRLAALTGRDALRERAEGTLKALSGQLAEAGPSLTLGLWAVDWLLGPTREVVIAGDPDAAGTRALWAEVDRRFLPRTVRVRRPAGEAGALEALIPFVGAQTARDGLPTAYVCRGFTCEAPVHTPAEVARLLDGD